MRLRVRPLLVAVALASALLTVVVILATVPPSTAELARSRGIDPELLVPAVRTSLLVAGGWALVGALALGLWAGGLLTRWLGAVRGRVAGVADGPAPVAELEVPVVEIAALATAAARAHQDVRRRLDEATRERDELTHLLHAVEEGILHVDRDGRVVRANPSARQLLRLPADVAGQPFASAIRSAPVRSAIARALDGRGSAPMELAIEERRLLTVAEPFRVRGEPSTRGAIVVLVDLTQVRRLESVRRDFVANVSHELKTPLTSIRGYAETLLDEDVPDDVRRRFLDTIADNARRLQRIVDDLLDLSSVESGGWRPRRQPVDVEASAHDGWKEFAERAQRAGVSFGLDLPRRPLPPVSADPMALRQIFGNLFDNALRYTPAGGRIEVALELAGAGARSRFPAGPRPLRQSVTELLGEDEVRDLVQVEVRDSGAGVPQEALPRIFERFFRVDPARSRAEGGTGLGLAIVKHMVESMGGSVSAESELGKGTTIRFLLPVAAGSPPTDPPPATHAPGRST